MCPSRVSLLRRLQRLAHYLGFARDYGEVSARGLVGLDAALLPIAQRPERNGIARRKILLAQAECAPDDPRLRGALDAGEVCFGEEPRVGIVRAAGKPRRILVPA